MKTYFIESVHDICIDSYSEGEKENVNFYDIKQNVKAENPRQAIEKYFETELFFSFNLKYAYIVHEEEGEEEPQNKLFYSVLVEEENNEATEKDIEKWKQNKKTLYANNITIYIHELQPVRI